MASGHQLLYELHLHQLAWHLGAPIPHPSRRRLTRLPPLRLPRLFRHRALRAAQSNDVLRSSMLNLLDRYRRSPRADGSRRRLVQTGHRSRVLLLHLLRKLRHGRARRAVAVPYR